MQTTVQLYCCLNMGYIKAEPRGGGWHRLTTPPAVVKGQQKQLIIKNNKSKVNLKPSSNDVHTNKSHWSSGRNT